MAAQLELNTIVPSNAPSAIRVLGARTHNLRNIHVEIPLGSLTVITGVSGSGKSSLAFDTIFADGRYRYLSSTSAHSRELLQAVDRPDVDLIDGLPPVLCVEQYARGARRRATVATTSEIHEYLRLLFARAGQLFCPTCHQPVTAQSRAAIVAQALRSEDRKKVIILAPVIRERAGTHADVFARIVKDGFVRARVDGVVCDATAPPELAKSTPHNIEVVVDRLIVKEGIESRLEESIDLALQMGHGQCVLSHEVDGGWEDRLYSSRLACNTCGTSFTTLEPRTFSFNSPAGACLDCQGLGTVEQPDGSEHICQTCEGTRLGPLPRAVRIGGVSITDFCSMAPARAIAITQEWRDHFNQSLKANGDDTRTSVVKTAAQFLLPEIATRLQYLIEIGLDYVTLDRASDSLSAGEYQRARLAACLGGQLTGVCYILDEPTAGLHVRDTHRLLQTLHRLRDEGNTVVLVEHDLDVIRSADYVIDLGPGAGPLGGSVLAVGTPESLIKNPASITGPFLASEYGRATPSTTTSIGGASSSSLPGTPPGAASIRLLGATLHNLCELNVEIPLNQIVCVTGVSGSGKSSLIMQTLVPAVRRALGERIPEGGPFQSLSGTEALMRLIRVDQSPLGRSSRSSPATYSGIWDGVRQVFARTKESRLRGFDARRFSLAVPEARCPRCTGRGTLPVDEKRFSDWETKCPDCNGRRFSPSTLSVRYRGLNVADVLDLSLADAALFFENFSRLAKTLNLLNELGVGYLKLGQSTSTLSGGESQRIKLGVELAKTTIEKQTTLFVLDEPTSGLHAADVALLIRVLKRLVSEGHSVLVVEHNLELIAASDWVIDVGPGSGPSGGTIVAVGEPPTVLEALRRV
ncbi:excinuclease ABC subunit UvrA [Schlesneria paludicola]|uniref:excinuclease ABC subunit UvrA n=1 Tax=Schlesneria paludicola TaxID=360056 RepID=UPI00029A2710|nr:excinuclease ABC subunit UvrA [Schlesneria paludicola]